MSVTTLPRFLFANELGNGLRNPCVSWDFRLRF